MPFAESEAPTANPLKPSTPQEVPPAIARWVKTECGRAKYQDLAVQQGMVAKLRRWWFVLIAALRDWRLPPSPSA